MSKVHLQPCYILHAKPYRDTSNLLEVFTKDFGRIGLIARGVRSRKSRLQGLLQPFSPLLISWIGQGELHTLTHAENEKRAHHLKAGNLMTGFYINELIINFLHRDDPYPGLYSRYQETIIHLENSEHIEPALRLFERDLLQETGYGLIFDCDVESGEDIKPDRIYTYFPAKGPVLSDCHDEDLMQISGRTLLALNQDKITDAEILPEAKRLMRYLISWHMGGKPLKTRALFKQFLPL
ncbi:MAG: DNA repair protein RecO [Gammaproteobacteria bacterium]|jgi:DNA repair protein RecO (recombination protein O)